MINVTSYNFIRILASICFITVAIVFLPYGALGGVFLLMPYLLVFLLANQNTYHTPLRVYCRVTAGVLVSLISIAILFGIESDPQAGISVMFSAVIQYGVIFVAEAIIGLMTYEESES